MKFTITALRCVCVAAAMTGAAHGQTQIDLRTQGKNIDFSTAARTRPSKTGTSLPATCMAGETFLKTDAAAGRNSYVCTAANVWSVQGIEVPDAAGKADHVLATDGNGLSWQAFGGDVSGRAGAITVNGLGGRRLGSLTPLDGQYLKWNGIAQQWEPTTLAAALSVFGRSGAVSAQSGDYNFTQIAGTVGTSQLPSLSGDVSGPVTGTSVVRIQSRPVSAATPLSGQVMTWDGSQWGPQLPATGVSSIFGRSGPVTAQTGDYSFSHLAGVIGSSQLPSAGGDLSGSLSAATVTKIQGRAISSSAPSTGQVLTWSGTQWVAQASAGGISSAFGRTGAVTAQSGDYAFNQISGSIGAAQLPAAGGDLSGAINAATVTRLQSRVVSAAAPNSGQYLMWDGLQWAPTTFGGITSTFGRTGTITSQYGDYAFSQISGTVAGGQLPAAAGDLSGSLASPTVAGLQNRPVATMSPSLGQILGWDGAKWTPQTVASAVTSTFGRTGAVIAQTGDYTFSQIGGAASVGQLPATGGDLNGTLTSARVTGLQSRPVATTVPSSGQVLGWDGTQWSPQTVTPGGGGGFSTVDKTVSNTYTSGAKQTFVASLSTSGINVTPSTLPTNPTAGDISLDSDDANKLKIYDGGQWNTLVTVSSYVASFTNQTVVTVNGTTHRLGTANLGVECYDTASPAARVEADKVVVTPVSFNVSIFFATPQTGTCTLSGTGGVTSTGSPGAGMASQLGDLGLVLTSPTVLTAGLNCSNVAPCNARLGSNVFSVTNSSTITLTAGSGTLYLYLDASGILSAGHNLSLTCSGVCGALAGIAAFPAGSIPLFTWTATNGVWDSNGGSDKRAFLSTLGLASGTGIVALDTGSQTIVAVDSASVPTYLTASALVDFGSIPAGGCSESTAALPGASAGDSVAPGWPANLEGGLIGMMRISATNTVSLRICNLSGTAVDPAAATFRATVVRSF